MFARIIVHIIAFMFAMAAPLQVVRAATPNGTIFASTNPPATQWTTALVVQTNTGPLTFSQIAFPPESVPCTACMGGRGWYGHMDGRHNWNAATNSAFVNLNYIASVSGVRNYFVFDVDLGGATALSADLHLQNPGLPNPGFGGDFASLNYGVWDVTSPLSDVMAPNAGGPSGLAIWADLGSGLNYGSRSVSAADNGHFVDVALNSTALSRINEVARGDGMIGFGGALLVVPEPETYAMLLAGLGLLGWTGRPGKRQAA